jgi:hypothetical protein
MLEEDAKTAAGRILQDSEDGVAGVLRWKRLGGGYTAGEMRLGRRVPRAESTSLLR